MREIVFMCELQASHNNFVYFNLLTINIVYDVPENANNCLDQHLKMSTVFA